MITFGWAHKLCSVNEMFAWNKFRRSSHAKKERSTALKRAANALLATPLKPPFRVTITRVGRRMLLDDDNLATSAKHVRDGIAQALGVDDGDTSKVTWRYGQRLGRQYRVQVEMEEGA